MSDLDLKHVPAKLNHSECVAWGPDGRVYAGGQGGEIYRINLADNSSECYANTGGFVLGVTLDGDGNLYACDLELRQVVRVAPDGTRSTYSAGTRERPMRLPNYAVFDDHGNLYVSDSGDRGRNDGFIWRLKPGGAAEVWNETASGFPNGMCLAADGSWLYIAESNPPLISRVEIRADGTAGKRTVLVELPRTVPDGVALDQAGNLYISVYSPSLIYQLRPDGELKLLYDDWEQIILFAPTNLAFAGTDLKTLLVANIGWLYLAAASMAVPGLPLRYPRIGGI